MYKPVMQSYSVLLVFFIWDRWKDGKMKKAKLLGTIMCGVLMLINISASYGYTSFDISSYPGIESNALGLAVNPQNGNVFVSSLSYGGEDNLYEFNSAGDLILSSRAAFDTGNLGHIGSMVVGNDGHLIVDATYYPPSIPYILEMSQDGQTVFSSLQMDAGSGLSYSPQTGNLFYVDFISALNYQINEITAEGTLVSQFSLDEPKISPHYSGLVYDSDSDDFYVNEFRRSILHQYSKNELGEYEYVLSYDMKSLPFTMAVYAIDINRSNGLFYAQFGNRDVVAFNLDELNSFYVPELATILLFGLGGIVLRKRGG